MKILERQYIIIEMIEFKVITQKDINIIPQNVTYLKWFINEPLTDALQRLEQVTHIQFYTFYDKPFKLPPNIQEITILGENYEFISPLYMNYSEYLVEGTKSIKINDNVVEFILVGRVTTHVKLKNNDKTIKEVTVKGITYEEIEDFLTPGMNLKPAKN